MYIYLMRLALAHVLLRPGRFVCCLDENGPQIIRRKNIRKHIGNRGGVDENFAASLPSKPGSNFVIQFVYDGYHVSAICCHDLNRQYGYILSGECRKPDALTPGPRFYFMMPFGQIPLPKGRGLSSGFRQH